MSTVNTGFFGSNDLTTAQRLAVEDMIRTVNIIDTETVPEINAQLDQIQSDIGDIYQIGITAGASATAAEASADAAATSAAAAALAESNTLILKNNAETAANSASAAATSIASSTTTATTAATAAGISATTASSAKTAAESARDGAVSAKTAAETARDTAVTSKTGAEAALASTVTARDAAQASAASANTSATAAASSATAASASATTASTAATTATSAKTAAESARDATLAAYDSFDDRYLGARASDPTVDNDGNALVTGALYFNTSVNKMRAWSGSAWLDAYSSITGGVDSFNGRTGSVTLSSADVTGALSFTPIAGNQSITVSGDATGSGTTAITLTLADSGVTAGSYTSVTVDAKGRVTGGSSPTTLAGYGITDAAALVHNHDDRYYTETEVDTLLGAKANVSSLADYLTTASAASTYQPISSMSAYLTSASAASTYQTQAGMSSYQTVAGMASYLTSSSASSTYLPLTGGTLTQVSQGIVAVSASAIDCSAGNFFTKTASGALTWTFTNVPSAKAFTLILELTNGGSGTQTWPAAVKWPAGTAPTLTASGVDVLGFVTDDGGTTWRGVQLMKDSK